MSRFLVSPFDRYFDMWNEIDPTRVRTHLDQAVTEDFIFCDPLHWHVGREALHDNVQQFREKFPDARLHVTSAFDPSPQPLPLRVGHLPARADHSERP